MKFFSAVFAVAAVSAVASANQADNEVSTADEALKTCIDDSDCADLGQGNQFRCFMYICYPWNDDSSVAASQKRRTCRDDAGCDHGQECFRHHDKRKVHKGLCFDKVQDCYDNPNVCTDGYGCCGSYCCEPEYFAKFRDLPCSSDFGCQDLGLGKYCCPRSGNQTDVCCDTDPNPPPTQAPSVADGGGSGAGAVAASLLSLVGAVAIRSLLDQ